MADDSAGSELTDDLSRRRLLALAGTSVTASITGCSEGGSSSTDTETDLATDAPTDSATDTATDSASSSHTDSPTEASTATTDTPENAAGDCLGGVADAEYDLVVAEDGSGDYETVQAAFDAVEPETDEETRIFVAAGRYEEKLRLPADRPNVTVVGEDPAETVLTYDDHANKTGADGEELGTDGSASFFVDAADFTAKDVTFENAAEPVAQAVAVRTEGDRALFENCRFLGNQDTLYTQGIDTRKYFRDCYIEGDVDFIFGGAISYFENCEIYCKDSGYVTASGTAEVADYGYVFNDCEVTGEAANATYLGRPWQPYAQTVFMNCHLGDVVKPSGWDPWVSDEGPDKTETAFCAEYDNEGPGWTPDQRVDWAHVLSEDEAESHGDPVEVVGDWVPEGCL